MTDPGGPTLRWAEPGDFAALGQLVFQAVREGPNPYSDAQRAAWMPASRSGPEWNARLAAQAIIVAEDGERLLGFMSLAADGYIDFAYLLREARGAGLFRRLYDRIAALAHEQKQMRLWVHASLTAEPAFQAMGFAVVRREQVAIGDQELARCEMELYLGEA